MKRVGVGRRTALRWTAGWAVCVLIVVISGVSKSNPAVALSAAGHWVYNHSVGAVFHVDGASASVDGEVPTPHLSAAEQVVEDGKHGYVLDSGKSRVVVFGKSSLKVSSTLSTGTTEQPVVVQDGENPALIYQQGGNIIRLGDHQAVVHTGSQLSSPVGTSDGTVWVRRDDGSICRLGATEKKLDCVAHVPASHDTTLVTLDDRPAVVDVTAATITQVRDASGSGPLTERGVIPAGSQVGSSDAGGRLPIITPPVAGKGSSLLLVDTSTLGTGRAGATPISVPLGSDQFDTPLAAGASVVVVDKTTHVVYTFGNAGQSEAKLAVPSTGGDVRATRANDGRVYVDNGSGTNTLVVDGDGAIASVADRRPDPVAPLGGRGQPAASSTVANPTGSKSVPSNAPSKAQTPQTPQTPTAPRTPTAPPSTKSTTTTPKLPTRQPTGAPLSVDITPHSNDVVNVVWSNAGAGAHYVVQALPSGKIVCRSTVHSCDAVGLATGRRTSMKVIATTSSGATRAGVSADPETVIPWHWATAPTSVHALPGSRSISVSWKAPKDLKAGVVIGYNVALNGKDARRTTGRHVVLTGLKSGKLYRINISAISKDPNGSGVTIGGDESTTFLKAG